MECLKEIGCPVPECIDPDRYKETTYTLMNNLPVGTPRQPPVERFSVKDIGTPRFTELVNVLCRGMQGSIKSPPDAAMDWILNEKGRRNKHATPLSENPSDLRRKMFLFCMQWSTTHAIEHNGCFAIRDPTTYEMVSAAVCFPPSEDKIYQVGLCKFLKMIWGLTLNGKDFPEGVSSARMEALQETMKRLHEGNAPDQHWYVMHVSTLPNYQGKGYGKKLMQFIAKLADADRCPIFLEVTGKKNQDFYEKLDYVMKEQIMTEFTKEPNNNPTLDENGGMMGMIRLPRDEKGNIVPTKTEEAAKAAEEEKAAEEAKKAEEAKAERAGTDKPVESKPAEQNGSVEAK